ncbi:hypothetical protein IMCC1989_1780 [gamma proteobacterium IMCC1989]|nr:hypothetical protein IMCC1989_1780 [gamma proteobacterium IMCC1989]
MDTKTQCKYTHILSALTTLDDNELMKAYLAAKFLNYLRSIEELKNKKFTAEELDEMVETKLELDAELRTKQKVQSP